MAKFRVEVFRVSGDGNPAGPCEQIRVIPVVAVDASWAAYFGMKLMADGGGFMPAGQKQASRDGLAILVKLVP